MSSVGEVGRLSASGDIDVHFCDAPKDPDIDLGLYTCRDGMLDNGVEFGAAT